MLLTLLPFPCGEKIARGYPYLGSYKRRTFSQGAFINFNQSSTLIIPASGWSTYAELIWLGYDSAAFSEKNNLKYLSPGRLDTSSRVVCLLLRERLPRVFEVLGRGWDLRGCNVAAHNVVAKEVEELIRTVAHEAAKWDVKDSVEFFQCFFLSLGKEEEYEEEADDVP